MVRQSAEGWYSIIQHINVDLQPFCKRQTALCDKVSGGIPQGLG